MSFSVIYSSSNEWNRCHLTIIFRFFHYISEQREREEITAGKMKGLIHFPVSAYASAGCRYCAPESTGKSYEVPQREEERSIFLACLARSGTDQYALKHTNCVIKCTRLTRDIPFHSQTGNSSGVGVWSQTNADESSFCEPHHFFFFWSAFSAGTLDIHHSLLHMHGCQQ